MISKRDQFLEELQSESLKKAFKQIEDIDIEKSFEEHRVIFEDLTSYVDCIIHIIKYNPELLKK